MNIKTLFLWAGAYGALFAGECRVALDIGHDPKHPGATSCTGKPEYRFNRRAALMAYRYLRNKGVDAFFINSDEEPIALMERCRKAKEYHADIFVSFHHDSVQESFLSPWVSPEGRKGQACGQYEGYSIFVSKKNPQYGKSLALAKAIGGSMRSFGLTPCTYHGMPIKHENRTVLDPYANVYEFSNLVVLKKTPMPSVLIELGMIVNPKEEQELWQVERLLKEANAVSDGIVRFCKSIKEEK